MGWFLVRLLLGSRCRTCADEASPAKPERPQVVLYEKLSSLQYIRYFQTRCGWRGTDRSHGCEPRLHVLQAPNTAILPLLRTAAF